MATLLLERSVFLEKEVMQLLAPQMKALADPASGRYPTCSLCNKATLRPRFETAKAEQGATEILVRLPCSHVFGRECMDKYFRTARPADGLYEDRCPQCGVRLFAQESRAQRFERVSEPKEAGIYISFSLAAAAMLVLCVMAVFTDAFAWQWVFLFAGLATTSLAGIGVFRKHVAIRKELVDLERGHAAAAALAGDAASARHEECDADADTDADAAAEPGASSEKDGAGAEDGGDEERAGLLSNPA